MRAATTTTAIAIIMPMGTPIIANMKRGLNVVEEDDSSLFKYVSCELVGKAWKERAVVGALAALNELQQVSCALEH